MSGAPSASTTRASVTKKPRPGILSTPRQAYLRANIYYALAWFPGNYTPEERLAYDQQLSVYQKAGALFDAPLEVVNVPFRESHLITYVHRPAGIEKPPLVIWTGGSDQYKANHYRPIQGAELKGIGRRDIRSSRFRRKSGVAQ